MRAPRHRLLLALPLTLVAGLLAPVTAHAATPPQVQITSPADATSVEGQTSIAVTGSVDAAGSDAPQHFQLYLDGVAYGPTEPCPPPGKSCSLPLTWYAVGSPGLHHVYASMVTVNGAVATSATLALTEVDTPPSATISSPSAGAVVAGDDVEVDATGTIDPRENDYPYYVELLVDGTEVDDAFCDDYNTLNAACPVVFDWDASIVSNGDHTLRVVFRTQLGAAASSAVEHVTVVQPPVPSVQILSPAANASVSGTVPVSITATVSPTTGDSPYELVLFADGDEEALVHCATGSQTCTGTASWDSSNYAGPVRLEAEVLTQQTQATSAPVDVTVSAPTGVGAGPSVVISSPQDNAVVRGVVSISATGSLPVTSNDPAEQLQLLVDGSPVGSPVGKCGAYNFCAATFSWDTQGLTGTHTVAVRFDTASRSVTSAPEHLIVGKPLKQAGEVRLSLAGYWLTGRYIAYGKVSTSEGEPLAGVKVAVTVTPGVGHVRTLTVVSQADGRFYAELKADAHVRAALKAKVGAAFGGASKTGKAYVYATIHCSVPKTFHHGVATRVTCSLPRLADGTTVTLHDRAGASHVLGHAVVTAGKASFTVTVAKPASKLAVWATMPETHRFSASQSVVTTTRAV